LRPKKKPAPSGAGRCVSPSGWGFMRLLAARAPEPYAFEGETIKLTAKDFNGWERALTYLDLRAELYGLDGWATREKLGRNWFHAVSAVLAKNNRAAKLEIERIRAEAEAAAKLKAAPSPYRVIL